MVAELRNRWRRRARNLAVLYSLWSLFWGLLATSDLREDLVFESLLTPVCALIGALAVATCLAVRYRFRAEAMPDRLVT